MPLHLNMFRRLDRHVRGLLMLLPLLSATILSAALLVDPTGAVAVLTTFQSSPVSTPTLASTRAAAPSPTNLSTPTVTQPVETSAPASVSPTNTATAASQPTDALPATTLVPTSLLPTLEPAATPSPTDDGAIQMPLLPPTARPRSIWPTPTSMAASKSLSSAGAIGGIVAALLIVLAVLAGLFFGVVLKSIAPGEAPPETDEADKPQINTDEH